MIKVLFIFIILFSWGGIISGNAQALDPCASQNPPPYCNSGGSTTQPQPTFSTCIQNSLAVGCSDITAAFCAQRQDHPACVDAQLAGADQLQELDLDQINSLGARLYCDIYDVMSQNVGLLLGFVLSAWGFWNIVTSGFGMGSLIMILAGVFFTAIPGLLENTLNDGSTFVDGNGLGEASAGFNINRGRSACN